MDKYVKLVIVIGGVVVFILIASWLYLEETDCKAAGGERLRPLFGLFKCYDIETLRPLNHAFKHQP